MYRLSIRDGATEVSDEERLGRSLQKLAPWKRIAVMAQVGERTLPNHQRFSAETGFGIVLVLRNVLDAAWTWIESGRLLGNSSKPTSSRSEASLAYDELGDVPQPVDTVPEPTGASSVVGQG
ncbi:DUF416 family protein [Sorangium sp. So ce385]|uniref:DUF416 family protein n=1 Tax=Sorangium sp. So ce385 TaxID=3133308 RepID=UPI003F5BD057